jgi:hypothetical protein
LDILSERRTLTRRVGRIENINIDRDIYLAVPNALLNLLDDTTDPKTVEVTGLDNFEATAQVVADIAFGANDGRANADMDRRVAN